MAAETARTPDFFVSRRSRRTREILYRQYMEFFEHAERTRRWNVFNDIPWELADPSRNDPVRALNVETFCAIEWYLPDYVSKGVNCVRDCFGQSWFQVNWGYEEARHGLSLRLYLERTGQRTPEQLFDLEEAVSRKVWDLPFPTPRQMVCYGSLQEASTHLAYRRLIADAEQHGDALLVAVVKLIARDEAAHHGFYRQVLKVELEEDRTEALDDLAHVLQHFHMPVWDLFDDEEERLAALRAHGAFDTWGFRTKIWKPLLTGLGVSQEEMNHAFQRARARDEAAEGEDEPAGDAPAP